VASPWIPSLQNRRIIETRGLSGNITTSGCV
jgi:hypothetical protein